MNKIFDTKSTQNLLKNGLETIYHLLKMTHGPHGKNILLDEERAEIPQLSKQSAYITKKILLKEKIKNITLLLVQESLNKINKVAGDGSTTSFLITYFLLINSFKNIFQKIYSLEIKTGIKKTINHLILLLNEFAEPIMDTPTLQKIVATSLYKESALTVVVSDAIHLIGKQGMISVEETNNLKTSLEIQNGMKFKRGYFSSYFVTDPSTMRVELDDPFIFISTQKISFENSNWMKLLEQILYLKKPLVILSPEIDEEALSTLILNKINGLLDVVYIKVPKISPYESIFLEDIALYTEAYFFRDDNFFSDPDFELQKLGRAKKIIVTKTNTTILRDESIGIKDIEERCDELKKQVFLTDSDYEKEKLDDRIKNMYGLNAVLKVGGVTDLEVQELKTRLENSIYTTKSALHDGILPGGAVSLLHLGEELENWSRINLKRLELVGSLLVVKAIFEPTKNLIRNNNNSTKTTSGNPIMVESLVQSKDFQLGFDILSQKKVDMIEYGIIDSIKSIIIGLQTSSSLTQMILTIDKFVSP